MQVYTRIVLDMTQDDLPVIESESYEYEGPVDLCMPSDGSGGRSGGDGDRGSGGETDGGRDGSSGNAQGGFGNRAVSRGGLAVENSIGWGGGIMGDALSDVMGGIAISAGPTGFFDAMGNRVAYASGSPTSYGSMHATAAMGGGMPWSGDKALSRAVSNARAGVRSRDASLSEQDIMGRINSSDMDGRELRDAVSALNHGQYGGLQAQGLASAADVAALHDAYDGPVEALGRALGSPSADVTTPYDSYTDAVHAGLMDTRGTLTAKGWGNVVSPALSVLAGPLASLGYGLAGIPGAIAGALAPNVTKAAVSSNKSNAVGEALGNPVTTAMTGVDLGGLGMGLGYAADMASLSRAQGYAGTQPERPGASEVSDGGEDFRTTYEQFFRNSADQIAGSSVANSGINPHFASAYSQFFRG